MRQVYFTKCKANFTFYKIQLPPVKVHNTKKITKKFRGKGSILYIVYITPSPPPYLGFCVFFCLYYVYNIKLLDYLVVVFLLYGTKYIPYTVSAYKIGEFVYFRPCFPLCVDTRPILPVPRLFPYRPALQI